MRIFYSWQSDLPNNTNRGFIQSALEIAIKELVNDDEVGVEPVLDRDTANVAGAPDITSTIFDKIARSDSMVCDITVINQGATQRLTPNPNVLIELGYGAARLGWDRMILVANTAFSSLEDLPFDLRQRRILTYISSSENPDRASPKKILARSLAQAVKAILLSRRELTKAPSLPFPDVRISCSAKSFLETGAPRSKTFHFLQLRIENHSLQHLFLAGFAIQLNNGRRLALLKDHFTGEIWNDRRLETGNSETWNIDPKYLNRDPSEMVCPMVTDRIGREFLGDAVEFQQALALAISPA